MNIDQEWITYNVSRETVQKLKEFVAILQEWNVKMNLVSRESLKEVWTRHVFDCAQLVTYISSETKTIVDIGSGAGFPGIVLAILLAEKLPQVRLFLVESIAKKAAYLNDVCQRLSLKNVRVIHDRVENAVFKHVDVITARAVAALPILCSYAAKIGNSKTTMLLLKGKNFPLEEKSAAQNWIYQLQCYPNKYCAEGVIAIITKLRKRP